MKNKDFFWMHGINPVKGRVRPTGFGVPSFNKYSNVKHSHYSEHRLERLKKRYGLYR